MKMSNHHSLSNDNTNATLPHKVWRVCSLLQDFGGDVTACAGWSQRLFRVGGAAP